MANALEVTTDYLLGRVEEPTVAAEGDPLFRDVGKLTGDRELAKDFIKILAERSAAKAKTLTVIACPALVEGTSRDEDDDDEGMVERWTPRFRK